MQQLFPSEIIENTVESYHTQINTRSRAIYGIIVAIVLLIIASLPFVYIDVTTPSRGVIRTPSENTTIQSAVYGQITMYNLYENKTVLMGDTLLLLNSENLTEQQTLIESKLTENRNFISDIDKLLTKNYKALVTPKYISEYKRFTTKTNEREVTINFLKKDLETTHRLMEKNVIASNEYLLAKNNYEKALEELNSIRQEYWTTWQAEQTNLKIQNLELESKRKQIEDEKKQYTIVSPISGILVQVAGYRKGNFIAPGQTLCYISANDSLIAECYISPADIGYIFPNQPVSIQLDAYNYRQWGMIDGCVTEVLQDVVLLDNKPMFRVRCTIDQKYVQLKNGYKGNIQKGLTFTAQFKLNRRSLWQLLFDKLDNWLNPKMMKE
ncbi:MAG TPA: efflux RND transporter periplasmic adaptor subunit [Paludibacteraceae bacterium]|nr:efflux RND transporter periplasmic adaptor subunit [Paludibacteraceae bacterium]